MGLADRQAYPRRYHDGMTYREYLAAEITRTIVSDLTVDRGVPENEVAARIVSITDAIIARLEQ